MNIKQIGHKNFTLFENLSEGDVFELHGSYCMKICISNNLNNAVDLVDGEAMHVPDEKEVGIVDCELVIK
jgi:hypothetical protein